MGVLCSKLTSMYAENLIVDHHTEGQEVKHIGKIMPNIGVSVFARAFRIETVGLGHAPRLMISSNQMHTVGVS